MFQNLQKNTGQKNIFFQDLQKMLFNTTLLNYQKGLSLLIKKNLELVLLVGPIKKRV